MKRLDGKKRSKKMEGRLSRPIFCIKVKYNWNSGKAYGQTTTLTIALG